MPLGPIDFQATVAANGKSVGLSIVAVGMTRVISIERVKPVPVFPDVTVIVRGSDDVPASGGWNGSDFEAPAGVPIEYLATVEGDDETDTGTATVSVSGVDYGGDYLMPVGYPQLGININVEYGGMGDLIRDVQRSSVPVIGRPDPVVVSFGRRMWEGSMRFLTLNDGERTSFLNVVYYPVIMFVARPGFGFANPVFLSPGSVSEQRTVGLGSEKSRRFLADFIRVARPPAHYASALPSIDWQTYVDSSETWQDILDSNVIWFDFAGFRSA